MNQVLRESRHSGCRCWSIPRSWALLVLLDVCLVMFALARVESQEAVRENAEQVVKVERTIVKGPADGAANDDRFEAIDVFVDSGETALAAYQVELASRAPGMEIVGIEGGEHPAFRNAPYYDPRAIRNNRVILAAFHTGNDLPVGRSRVARVHVQLQGSGDREYETQLTATATADGQRIPAVMSIARAVAAP